MMFHKRLGISSSQLTFTPSIFRGVGQPPGADEKKMMVKAVPLVFWSYFLEMFLVQEVFCYTSWALPSGHLSLWKSTIQRW
jgi:hypothetical protein